MNMYISVLMSNCIILLMSSSALAQSGRICSPLVETLPQDPTTNEPIDDAYGNYENLICHQPSINKYWRAYGFQKKTWDGGFGFYSPCDVRRPLARMFAAMAYIDKAPRWGSYFDPYNSWHEETSTSYDTLNAACSNGNLNAQMDFGSNAEFYFSAWYGPSGNTIGELASIIIHEGRHEWKWHNGENCPKLVSCDESWDDSPVYRYEIKFMWDAYINQPLLQYGSYKPTDTNVASNYYLSGAQLLLMRNKANDRLLTRFETPPKFSIPLRREVVRWRISDNGN